jgi:transglutaminase-like putative cysteine protease
MERLAWIGFSSRSGRGYCPALATAFVLLARRAGILRAAGWASAYPWGKRGAIGGGAAVDAHAVGGSLG